MNIDEKRVELLHLEKGELVDIILRLLEEQDKQNYAYENLPNSGQHIGEILNE